MIFEDQFLKRVGLAATFELQVCIAGTLKKRAGSLSSTRAASASARRTNVGQKRQLDSVLSWVAHSLIMPGH